MGIVVACAPDCEACRTGGAARCDPGGCRSRFVYNSVNKTCAGEDKTHLKQSINIPQ